MGSFLHIGLRARLSTKKRSPTVQTADLRQQIGSMVDLSIYDEVENDGELIWSLKPALIESDLVPFIRKQFSLVPDGYATRWHEVMLRELQTVKTVDDLKNWCNTTSTGISHWNDYDSLITGQGWQRQHIPLELFVFVSTGKIIMEESGGVFEYFKSMITIANSEFQLAKAVCVSII